MHKIKLFINFKVHGRLFYLLPNIEKELMKSCHSLLYRINTNIEILVLC